MNGPRESFRRAAEVAIAIQFLALIRSLAEYFRQKRYEPQKFIHTAAEPFIVGSLITAVLTAVAVLLFFSRRYRLATAVGALTVLVLLVYRFAMM